MDRIRMRSVEIQARSVEEAVRLALEQLGRTRDQVHIEILMDSSDEEDGEALVRVTAKDGAPSRGRGKGSGTTTRPSVGARPMSRPFPEPANAPRVDAETEQVVKSIVHELLTAMGFQCTVLAVDNPSLIPIGPDEPPTVFIDVHGRDLGMLIGRRGENLAQLQYLVNVLVNKRLDTWTRVILDIEGYRSRREESLINLARRVARQVARNKRPISLEPMPANERRVVHVALRDDPVVTTSSSGEGALRRVTVYPK